MDRREWAQGLVELERLRRESPEAYGWNHLAYLQGVLLERQGDREGALEVFEPLAREDFPLQDLVLLRLVELCEEEARLQYAERFLTRHPRHPRWPAIALQHGRELRRQGRFAEALRWLDSLWRRRAGSRSRQAALEHALIHLDQDEESEGVRDLQRLLAKNEQDDVAWRAARELDGRLATASWSEEEARRMARVFLNNRDVLSARKYLGHLRRSFPSSPAADQYAYLWARSYVLEDRLGEALEQYREVYRKFGGSSWGVYSLYQAANTALRLLDNEEAERHYRTLIARHPDNRRAARARYHLADTYRWMNRPEDARRTLLEALRVEPRRERDQFRYSLARAALEAADFAEVLRHLEPLDGLASKHLPPGVTREEIHFWKGVALEETGQAAAAREAFATAAGGRPNYFGFLARSRLPDGNGPAAPADDRPWLARLAQPRSWRSAPPEGKKADRIAELLFLHLHEDAAVEIRRAGRAAFGGDRVSHLFNLAWYAARGGLAETSIRAAEQLQAAAFAGRDPTDLPPAVQSLLYPRHFWDPVMQHSLDNGVEPELVLSVIRQESRFQSDAKSPASARGLMQFMSGTALALAAELGMQAPSPEDLYRPEVSVRLGAYYLRKLLNRFDGSPEKALAAYNGGPDNVVRWNAKLELSTPELFVANIGYRETKLYVLRVMGNYFVYKSLASRQALKPGAPPLIRSTEQ